MSEPQDSAEIERLTQVFLDDLRAGGSGDVEAFAGAHPAHAARLRELLPVLVAMEALKPGAGVPQVPTPRAGDTPAFIGTYRVVRELGRGGMGRVFEARDALDQRVAVKIVHPHLVDRPGYLARFLREVDTGGRIDHPGVIRTLGSGVADDLGAEAPYLVLEFVEGQNLRELLADVSPLSERLCRVIGARVARALAAIHAADVVHRDVKPENVVITPDETVKLMDLGVALIQEEGQRLSQTGEFVGSLLYSAPEQLRGGTIGPRTDLYALGLVLFELLTGRHAGAEDGQSRPMIAAAPRDDVSVRAHARHVSAFMDALVQWLLQPLPDRRPQTAAQVAEILAQGEQAPWWQERAWGERQAAPTRADPGPLIGRADERAALDALTSSLGEGRGRACVIVGEPGIGKTHLLRAWLRGLASATQPPEILEVNHAAAARAGSLAAALGARLGPELPATVARLFGDAPALGHAVEQHLQGVEHDALSAEAAESAYLKLLTALARERGLVLAIENLHRASADRRAAFLRLLRAVANLPVVLVVTAREPLDETIAQEVDRLEHAQQIVLGPLDEAESVRLLSSVEGTSSSPGGVRALVRRSGGNPLYLLELARPREHDGSAAGRDGTIPESLGALLRERLAHLESGMVELLGAAACCEHAFDPDVVVTAVELPRIAGLRMLHALDRTHGLIRAEGTQYRFAQRLVQEQLHEDLPPALKAAYHSALAAVLEDRLPDGVDVPPEQARAIARHHLLGERPEGAVPYVSVAVDDLANRYEPGAVIALAERLRARGVTLPTDVRAHVAYRAGIAQLSHGNVSDGCDALREARDLGEVDGAPDASLRALIGLSDGLRAAGKYDEARALAEQAVEEARSVGDRALATQAYDKLSLVCRDLGDAKAAKEAAARGLEAAAEADDTAAIGRLTTTLGSLEVEQGNMEDARLLLDRGISIASLVGDRPVECNALTALAKIAFFDGRMATALPLLRRVVQIAYELGNTRLEGVTATNMALVMPSTGDYDEAASLARRAQSIGTAFDYPELVAHALMTLGQVHVDQGDYGRGLAKFAEAESLLAEMGTPTMAARLYLLLPNALAWTGRFEEADAVFARGLDAARSSSTPREVHMIEWAAALRLDAAGDPDAALAAATEANAALRSTGMELMAVQNDQRIAEFHVLEGRHDEARTLLEGALATAERGGLRGLAALSRAWLAMLPGGNPLQARQALEVHAQDLAAGARLRALKALAAHTGSAEDLTLARRLAEQLVASVPEAYRDAMVGRVALYRDLLR